MYKTMLLVFTPTEAESTYTILWKDGRKYRFKYETNPHEVPEELGIFLLHNTKHLMKEVQEAEAQAPVKKVTVKTSVTREA